MRLLRVYVNGFKRFADRTGFTVDAPVVALVGPNEAGKSSILEALSLLRASEAVAPGQLTRGGKFDPAHEFVSAVFLLEERDRELIAKISEAIVVHSVTIARRVDGRRRVICHPAIVRDTTTRLRAAATLRKAVASPSFRDRDWGDEEDPSDAVANLASSLDEAAETLSEETVESLMEVADALSELTVDEFPAYVRDLPKQLRELVERERLLRPAQRVANVLLPNAPQFEWFGSEARALRSSYEISELGESVPAALQNLAQLAGLDVAQLVEAVGEERRGEVQEIQEAANEALRGAYMEAWSQGRLSVSFNVEETTLHVFVREEGGTFWNIDDRSDGLRWFVALVALLAQRESDTPPILLVDEAEQHLHYDAQADLIRTFQEQTTAAGVIYTTHSAGCLPQDIGSGVKVVKRVDARRSEVKNGFWVDAGAPEQAGFSSVLMEMGATTLAFSSARHAVFCEGRTELVLLPTMLREACDWRVLPFQVAPGLASVNPLAVPQFDLAAARVAFLVDGDKAGALIAKKLRRAGVPADRICRLGRTAAKPATIEDFIDSRVHREAIHDELRASGDSETELPLSVFPAWGRAARLDGWFGERGVHQPTKVAVAHHVVSRAREGVSVCDSKRRQALARTAEQLVKILETGEKTATPAGLGSPKRASLS